MLDFTTGLRAAFAGALFLSGIAAAPAQGSPSEIDVAPQITVHYEDLNLNRAAGVQALYRRIQAAADTVCGVSGSSNVDFAQRLDSSRRRACAAQALADAVRSVDVAALTVLQAAKLQRLRGRRVG